MTVTTTRTTTSDERVETREAVVPAPPADIFALLADPAQHPDLDGSGMLVALAEGPAWLFEGATFSMKMKAGMPYTTHNRVVQLVPDRRIAWQHRARHVWRWELVPVEGGTLVRGSFDWSAKRAPRLVARIGAPAKGATAIEGTLARLRKRFT